jgi:hypothetical protein
MYIKFYSACALIFFCLTGFNTTVLGDSHKGHTEHGGKMKMPDSSACEVLIHLSEDAERQSGGALYQGPAMAHHKGLEGNGDHGTKMPNMKGAHNDHNAKHKGAFFMAPDKIHHLEAAYSERCGVQVYLYNAFTKPISTRRFQAFIKAIPNSDDEAEIIRFLFPNKNHTVLQARIGDSVTRPFKIELYLKFPEADDPELFSIHIPAQTK